MKILTHNSYKIVLPIIALLLASCGGGGDDSPPSSGSSAVGAPSSIIGKTLVERVSRVVSVTGSNVSTVQEGDPITYNFISSTEILGAGLNTIPTTSWSYSVSGNTAIVRLNYSVGKSVETLTFSSATSGTYVSVTTLNSGAGVTHEGTFTVSNNSGGSTSGGSTSGGSTGKLTIYTDEGLEGNITVRVGGSTVGTLTQHYPTGSPTCGEATAGSQITRTLTAGSYSVTATGEGGGTWSGNASITSGGCLNYRLVKGP